MNESSRTARLLHDDLGVEVNESEKDAELYDDDEPYVLEGEQLGPADMEELAGLPLAADGCVFVGCDLSLVSFHGVKNTRFESSKLRGTRFTKHVTKSVFESCLLAEARFRMMALRTVAFENCQLMNCDFYGSELSELSFPKSSVEGVGFDACTVSQVDLTGATQLLIGDPRTLKGAALCETQLPLIAHRLAQLSGIDIHDC